MYFSGRACDGTLENKLEGRGCTVLYALHSKCGCLEAAEKLWELCVCICMHTCACVCESTSVSAPEWEKLDGSVYLYKPQRLVSISGDRLLTLPNLFFICRQWPWAWVSQDNRSARLVHWITVTKNNTTDPQGEETELFWFIAAVWYQMIPLHICAGSAPDGDVGFPVSPKPSSLTYTV